MSSAHRNPLLLPNELRALNIPASLHSGRRHSVAELGMGEKIVRERERESGEGIEGAA